MRPVVLTLLAGPLVLVGPPGPPPPAAPAKTQLTVAGIVVLVGTPTKSGLSAAGGLTTTAPVEALGGTGTATYTTGLVGRRKLDATLADVGVAELVAALGADAVPAWLRPKLVGRVGRVTLKLDGDTLAVTANAFRIPNDPIKALELTADLKTGAYEAKIYALGGLVSATGNFPVK